MKTVNKFSRFYKLSYRDKLKSWDRADLDFKSTIQLFEDHSAISILPSGKAEQTLYLKWIINHWRKHFFNGNGKFSKAGVHINYQSFDDLVKQFNSSIRQLSATERTKLHQAELNYITTFISRFKPEKSFLKLLESCFKRKSEQLIYQSLQINKVSALLELRTIAKLWDIVKYRIYLEDLDVAIDLVNDEKRPQVIDSTPAIKSNYKELKLRDFDKKYLKRVYHDLTKYNFLIGDFTAFKNFTQLKEIEDENRITWADISTRRKSVNKFTLFALFDELFEPNSRMEYSRLVTQYFKYQNNAQSCVYKKPTVAQSLMEYREKKNLSTREEEIKSLFSIYKPSSYKYKT